jgi:hypothetical protein
VGAWKKGEEWREKDEKDETRDRVEEWEERRERLPGNPSVIGACNF